MLHGAKLEMRTREMANQLTKTKMRFNTLYKALLSEIEELHLLYRGPDGEHDVMPILQYDGHTTL